MSTKKATFNDLSNPLEFGHDPTKPQWGPRFFWAKDDEDTINFTEQAAFWLMKQLQEHFDDLPAVRVAGLLMEYERQ